MRAGAVAMDPRALAPDSLAGPFATMQTSRSKDKKSRWSDRGLLEFMYFMGVGMRLGKSWWNLSSQLRTVKVGVHVACREALGAQLVGRKVKGERVEDR